MLLTPRAISRIVLKTGPAIYLDCRMRAAMLPDSRIISGTIRGLRAPGPLAMGQSCSLR